MKNVDFKYLIERRGPLILSLLCSGFFSDLAVNSSKYDAVFNALINMAAIIIGFLTTMISILISVAHSSVLRKICRNDGIELLKIYFVEPIVSGFILIVLSVFLLSMDCDNIYLLCYHVFVFVFVYFLCSTVRISLIMLRIFENVVIEHSSDKKVTRKRSYPNIRGEEMKKRIDRANKENE